MSTRTRTKTIWCGLLATMAIALVAAQVGLSFQSREQAQTLLAPSFTAAQAAAGRATYTQNCASCHGANLDDGAFGPALRGPEFRASWFGRSADQLFIKLETMPPAAPATLGATRNAEVLAYLMSQNQLVAADKPVSSNLDELKGMLLPGATGGPSGGLTGGVPLPPAPRKANPLDRLTPVTDALLANPPAGGRREPGAAMTPFGSMLGSDMKNCRKAERKTSAAICPSLFAAAHASPGPHDATPRLLGKMTCG